MPFSTTRNQALQVDLREAILRRVAPDGGLYLPAEDIDLTPLLRRHDSQTAFVDLAADLTERLFGVDLPDAAGVARRAFPFEPRLRELDRHILLLELFHGPSCAFKDFGASFLAHALESLSIDGGMRIVILVATSGDTGGAVARAFAGRSNIDVAILYPSGRVSPLQEQQLTTMDDNVQALEIDGSFDDCQHLVKSLLADPELQRRLTLTTANSINLGRLLPQTFYYLFAYMQTGARTTDEPPLWICVPSGNFGNLTAGVLAWRWGMQVSGFIAATNRNDIVPLYLQTGRFQPRPSVATLSNAMDVGNPNNFERLSALFDNDIAAMRSMIHGMAVGDEETLATMRRWHRRKDILLDPHTATGVQAAEWFIARHPDGDAFDGRIIVLSTAHPGKFGETVRRAIGSDPDIPERLAEALDKPKRAERFAVDLAAIRHFLLERYDD